MAGTENHFYALAISHCTGKPIKVFGARPVSGGCINNAVVVDTDQGQFFLKWHSAIPADMFEKEAMGLQLLAEPNIIKIPGVRGYGHIDGRHFLVLECIRSVRQANRFWENFGIALADLHRNSSKYFGLDHDNYIGKLPQANTPTDNWIDFFIRYRLEAQLLLAIENSLVTADFIKSYRNFYNRLPQLLPAEKPSLLHGDLWSGNVMVGADGQVCLIDPAVYYGHREIELAFTTMFGGFDDEFYSAYEQRWPLEPGWRQRFDIYNIYPSMVHANLFGTSYLSGVRVVLRKYQ
ncbi:MAG: fructosamine kinase family protein [Cyclobacteriaceae bacterium]|nr:fructosamine kinase family protein [Cyclobacteriaceae bacterium]